MKDTIIIGILALLILLLAIVETNAPPRYTCPEDDMLMSSDGTCIDLDSILDAAQDYLGALGGRDSVSPSPEATSKAFVAQERLIKGRIASKMRRANARPSGSPIRQPAGAGGKGHLADGARCHRAVDCAGTAHL